MNESILLSIVLAFCWVLAIEVFNYFYGTPIVKVFNADKYPPPILEGFMVYDMATKLSTVAWTYGDLDKNGRPIVLEVNTGKRIPVYYWLPITKNKP